MIGILEKKKEEEKIEEEKKEEKTQLSFENQGSMLVFIYFFLVKLYEMKFKENNPQKRREGKSGGTKGG